jgi:hypothetical protein
MKKWILAGVLLCNAFVVSVVGSSPATVQAHQTSGYMAAANYDDPPYDDTRPPPHKGWSTWSS